MAKKKATATNSQDDTKSVEKSAEKPAAKHRQCPICYGGQMKGTGKAYSTNGMRTYYKCQMCGHPWSVEVKEQVTVITHKEIKVVER